MYPNMHKFQQLGWRRLWGVIILPTTYNLNPFTFFATRGPEHFLF